MSKTIINVSDAYALIQKKILLNRMSIKNLEISTAYSHTLKQLEDINIKVALEKIKLIGKLNIVMEKQLMEFCEIRQNECNDIIADINALDKPTAEYIEWHNKAAQYKKDMLDLMEKIAYISEGVPQQKPITNYKVSIG